MTTPPQTHFNEGESFLVQRYFKHLVPPSESLDPESATTIAPEDTAFKSTFPVDIATDGRASISAASSEDVPIDDTDSEEAISEGTASNVGTTSWQEAADKLRAEIQSLTGKTYKLPTETELWQDSRGCYDTTLKRMEEEVKTHCHNTKWLQEWMEKEYPNGDLYKALTSCTADEKVAQSVWEAIQNIVSNEGPSRKAMRHLNKFISSSVHDSDTGRNFIAECNGSLLVKARSRGKKCENLVETLREMREELEGLS